MLTEKTFFNSSRYRKKSLSPNTEPLHVDISFSVGKSGLEGMRSFKNYRRDVRTFQCLQFPKPDHFLLFRSIKSRSKGARKEVILEHCGYGIIQHNLFVNQNPTASSGLFSLDFWVSDSEFETGAFSVKGEAEACRPEQRF